MAKTISGTQIIDSAKRLLKITQTNEFDGDFNIWLQIGREKLYNLNTYKTYDEYLPIANGRAKLPKKYVEFIGCIVNGGSTIDTGINGGNPLVYYSKKYLSTATSTTPLEVTYYDYMNVVQEIDGFLDFGSLTSNATECHLWYKGVPMDDDGQYVYDEEAEEALKYFLAWRYSEFGNGLDLEKRMPYFAQMFDREAGILRGKIAKRDSVQRKYQLTATANAILNFYEY